MKPVIRAPWGFSRAFFAPLMASLFPGLPHLPFSCLLSILLLALPFSSSSARPPIPPSSPPSLPPGLAPFFSFFLAPSLTALSPPSPLSPSARPPLPSPGLPLPLASLPPFSLPRAHRPSTAPACPGFPGGPPSLPHRSLLFRPIRRSRQR